MKTLPWRTWLLTLAQTLNITTAVISVTVSAVAGSSLAPDPSLGTVPYGAQFAAVLLCTYPAAMLMQKLGRRIAFLLGGVCLTGGGILGYFALARSDFALLVAAHAVLGMYIAFANFYRFAAVDGLDAAQKPRALSIVVAGGVLAAVAGPALASALRTVPGFADFSLCYLACSLLGVCTIAMMLAFGEQRPAAAQALAARAGRAPLRITPGIATAIFAAAGGYLIMNLLMVQASLVLKDICSFGASARAIQAHVLAMFLPSFFTGSLIARFGVRLVLCCGFLLLLAGAACGMGALSYEMAVAELVLVGLGWNFTYVGGGALLTQEVQEDQRHRWQGINETLIAACATAGAFLPAPMLAAIGWQASNGMVVALSAAGIALAAWTLRQRTLLTQAGR